MKTSRNVLASSPASCPAERFSPHALWWAGVSLLVPGSVGCMGTSTVGSGCRPAASPSDRSALGGIWRPGRTVVPGGRPRKTRSDG